jgi:hypothetical protein
MTVFGPPLHELDRDTIVEFLEDAESEPLLWEAKGTELHKHDIRRTICGFANGNETGYLLLGVVQPPGGGWEVPGVEFPGDDPPVWLSSVAGSAIRPVPTLDVRVIPVDGKRKLAIVAVPPVATPPCVYQGTVYERVSGATLSVKDPARLSELYQRGQHAHRRAKTAAEKLANELISEQGYPGFNPDFTRFSLAVNSTGHPANVGGRLFSQDYEREILSIMRKRLVAPHGNAPPAARPHIGIGSSQNARTAVVIDEVGYTHTRFWTVRATWDGSVGIHYMTDTETVLPGQLAEGAIKDAWLTGSDLLQALAGYGPTYMELRVEGATGFRIRGEEQLPLLSLSRGPLDEPPGRAELASVERELRRARGETVYEGEVDSIEGDPESA